MFEVKVHRLSTSLSVGAVIEEYTAAEADEFYRKVIQYDQIIRGNAAENPHLTRGLGYSTRIPGFPKLSNHFIIEPLRREVDNFTITSVDGYFFENADSLIVFGNGLAFDHSIYMTEIKNAIKEYIQNIS